MKKTAFLLVVFSAAFPVFAGRDISRAHLGPWLSNPAADAMTVSFVSRVPCAAAIEYREKGAEKWTRRWNALYGMLDHTRRVHVFHLTGLKAATDYEYRFAVVTSQYRAGGHTVVGRTTWTFRTFDPSRRDFTVLVTSDIHGAGPGLERIYSRGEGSKADFFVFLGDNVDDNMHMSEFFISIGYLRDVVRLWGTSRPTLVLRGNHDSWGHEAAPAWGKWHGHPSRRGYYAVTQGNALFICFDVAEEYGWGKVPSGRETSDAYCEEEARWLKELKKTPAWKNAKWRIGLSHFGVVTGGADWHYRRFARYFGETLNDPADPVDLMLCGHMHRYLRCDAGSTNAVCGAFKVPANLVPSVTNRWNFTEISLPFSGILTLEIGENTLKCKARSNKFVDKGVFDEVTLLKK